MEDMERHLSFLHRPDDLVALVALDGGRGIGRTGVGFYRDHELLREDARRLSGRANLYINLNTINPEIYGRAADRFKPYATKTFATGDIIDRRRTFYVDLDPVRPAGVNATAAELQHVVDVAKAIRDYLHDQWQVEPLAIESGNGVHLYYPIDEPLESPYPALVLRHLQDSFQTGDVEIDQSVADLPQLVRLAGTMNCKGDDIPDRPRRMVEVLDLEGSSDD